MKFGRKKPSLDPNMEAKGDRVEGSPGMGPWGCTPGFETSLILTFRCLKSNFNIF